MARSLSKLQKSQAATYTLVTCGKNTSGGTVKVMQRLGGDRAFYIRNGNSLQVKAGDTLDEAIIKYNLLVVPDDSFDMTRSLGDDDTETDVEAIAYDLDSIIEFVNEVVEYSKDGKLSLKEIIALIPNGVEIIRDMPQLNAAYGKFLAIDTEKKLLVLKRIFGNIQALEKHHAIIDDAFTVAQAIANVIEALTQKYPKLGV